jgi:hypothetical protein
MNDPDLTNEPQALRQVHAVRLKIYDEIKDMTVTERTAYFHGCVKKQEDGDILLRPREFVNKSTPIGLAVSPVTLSRMGFTIPWFIKFLGETESGSDVYPTDGRTYRAFRDSNNVFLEDNRNGIANIVGFSSVEVPYILALLQYYMNSQD